jgi:transcriptional regulator GlxA family with amidase domain
MAEIRMAGQHHGPGPTGEKRPGATGVVGGQAAHTAPPGDLCAALRHPPRPLNARLHHIQNWPQLAHEANYAVSALAKSCSVSVRNLERLFLPALGETPRRLLKRLRMQRAIELLRDGSTVKETPDCLGYADPSHFSREFKNHYGFAPNKNANPPARTAATPNCRIRP